MTALTFRGREVRWRHHVHSLAVRPFDPAYALNRTAQDCGCSENYVRAILREHGSITFGRADGGLLCEGEPCLRPQCGERSLRPADQAYCSLDCAISDRAAA